MTLQGKLDLLRMDGAPKPIDEIVAEAVFAALKRRRWRVAPAARDLVMARSTIYDIAEARGVDISAMRPGKVGRPRLTPEERERLKVEKAQRRKWRTAGHAARRRRGFPRESYSEQQP